MKEDISELTQLEKANDQITNAKKIAGYSLCGIGIFVLIVTIAVAINTKNAFLFIVGILETTILAGAGIFLIRHSKKQQEKAVEKIGKRIKEAHAHKKRTERKSLKRARKKKK